VTDHALNRRASLQVPPTNDAPVCENLAHNDDRHIATCNVDVAVGRSDSHATEPTTMMIYVAMTWRIKLLFGRRFVRAQLGAINGFIRYAVYLKGTGQQVHKTTSSEPGKYSLS